MTNEIEWEHRDYSQYPREPDADHADHQRAVTRAHGVMYCYDCGEWYRAGFETYRGLSNYE